MIEPTLHVEEHRSDAPGAPVVVLVHGVLDSCASFDGVIEHLVSDYTVVTYDRRGWARSAGVPTATSLDDHAHDLLAVLGERHATVVGHSYGATVSMLAAVRAPDRIDALGLFEPSMQWQPWWPSTDVIAAEAPDERSHLRAGLEGRPKRTAEEREREQTLLAHELTLIADAPSSPDDLTVPRIVGRGTLSVRWRFATTDRLREELECELVEIDDAGHTAHRMQPKGFADFARRAAALGEGA